MRLDSDESKIKTFLHHPLPFVFMVIKTAIASLPFFLVASFFRDVLDSTQMFYTYAAITGIFVLIVAYEALVYFLDRLVITNKRIVHVDWKTLFRVEESGAEFHEIQDIETTGPGILAIFPFLNYGKFILETAATTTAIIFKNATDPEGIKHFIYHLQQKHSIIMEAPLESPTND